jgi:DNA polymerase V
VIAKITLNPEQLREALRIPLCLNDGIPAGTPESLDDEDREVIDLNDQLINNPDDTYGLTVYGDSMDEDEIHSGDLILVDRLTSAKADSIVVVDVDGGLTVKKFSMVGNRLFLIPGNRNYQPKEISREQRCEIWGVVTYVIHKKF